MGQRAEALAKRFEQANDEFAQAVEQCSDASWRALCQAEGWPVAVAAHHAGSSTAAITGFVQMVAAGQPLPPLTIEQLDQGNADHARQFANCTKRESLDLLRRNGESAADLVRGLSDEQLDRTGTIVGAPMSAQQVIENILIGHLTGHLASIRAATLPTANVTSTIAPRAGPSFRGVSACARSSGASYLAKNDRGVMYETP